MGKHCPRCNHRPSKETRGATPACSIMTLAELMNKADLKNDEFAALMNVAKITVLKWKSGGNVHPFHADKFDAVCVAVSEAVYHKTLPLSEPRMRGESPAPRVKKQKRIINRYLHPKFKIKLND